MTTPEMFPPGMQIAHYRLDRLLGKGGMGEVHLATDAFLSRKVALKLLPPELAADAAKLERFLQEARIASSLNHPNVAHIYEVGSYRGTGEPPESAASLTFIAMEYVDGETLATRLLKGPLSYRETLAFALQIADALQEAHAQGIIHRDIKPANIMINSRGAVKVLDFGLAKHEQPFSDLPIDPAADDTRIITQTGLILGTVAYMSPEQAMGRTLDHRSDLFSLGTVLYEMLSGKPPFFANSTQESIARLLNARPEPVTDCNAEIPEGIERIVCRLLEKEREKRYQTADDLLTDLRALPAECFAQSEVLAHADAPPKRAAQAQSGSELRAVIVDDEELARALVREYLKSCPGVEVVAECANGFQAVKVVSELHPDLVFLDVQMPKLDGFEVLDLIPNDIAVVFTTAYDQYAMRAFDAHAVDYLLKPFSLERFQKALERARERVGEKQPSAVEIAAAARAPEQYLQRIVVRDGTKVHIIPAERLDYVEAQDDYVSLLSEKKGYLKQQTISSLEQGLDPQRFVRIHRSYIVNIERVARIEPFTKDSRVVILSDGTQLPVSRSGYGRLKTLLDEAI